MTRCGVSGVVWPRPQSTWHIAGSKMIAGRNSKKKDTCSISRFINLCSMRKKGPLRDSKGDLEWQRVCEV